MCIFKNCSLNCKFMYIKFRNKEDNIKPKSSKVNWQRAKELRVNL